MLSVILLNDVSKTSFTEHCPQDCISANRAGSRIQGAFTGKGKASVIAEARHLTLLFSSVQFSVVSERPGHSDKHSILLP